jgi:hypothetical protein
MKIPALLLSLLTAPLYAQQIQNVKAAQAGDNVLITYDLAEAGTRNYFVRLLYSKDGGITYSDELRQVTGDVRDNITGGTNKKIIWDARQEVGSFVGEAVFKVEALTKATAAAAPVQNKCLKVELTDIKRMNSRVQVDFNVTPINGNTTVYLSAFATNTFLQDAASNRIKITDGFIAGTPKGKDKAALNGVPLSGYVTFDGVDPNLSTIPQLQLYIGAISLSQGACAANDGQAAFNFTNVAVSR